MRFGEIWHSFVFREPSSLTTPPSLFAKTCQKERLVPLWRLGTAIRVIRDCSKCTRLDIYSYRRVLKVRWMALSDFVASTQRWWNGWNGGRALILWIMLSTAIGGRLEVGGRVLRWVHFWFNECDKRSCDCVCVCVWIEICIWQLGCQLSCVCARLLFVCRQQQQSIVV